MAEDTDILRLFEKLFTERLILFLVPFAKLTLWSNQVSKKRAAELMLEELRKLPALPPTSLIRVKRKPTTKKKSRNLIKVGQEASIPLMLLLPQLIFFSRLPSQAVPFSILRRHGCFSCIGLPLSKG